MHEVLVGTKKHHKYYGVSNRKEQLGVVPIPYSRADHATSRILTTWGICCGTNPLGRCEYYRDGENPTGESFDGTEVVMHVHVRTRTMGEYFSAFFVDKIFTK